MNEGIDVICLDGGHKNCPIKLDGVFCDGYNQNASFGVFTHFHEDHVSNVHKYVGTYDTLLTHPKTFKAICALKPAMQYRDQWVTQDYDTKYRFDSGTVRLLKSNHIPGSAQVYVESDGKNMLYSGDFGYPDVQIREADYLVLDSTHGSPYYDGVTDRKQVKKNMFEYVEEYLKSNQTIMIQAAGGTIQEIIHYFEVGYGRRMDNDIVFAMEEKQSKVLDSLYEYDAECIRPRVMYGSRPFWEMLRTEKCVFFSTKTAILDDELSDKHKIIVDRYMFKKDDAPIRPFNGGCRFNLAAHASIHGIYQYVEDVNPKYVITDNSRGSHAKLLAKLIEQRFPKIKTECRPP